MRDFPFSLNEASQGSDVTWKRLYGSAATAALGEVASIQGYVRLGHRGRAGQEEAREATVLRAGDTLESSASAHAEITLYDGSHLRLNAGSKIKFDEFLGKASGKDPGYLIVQLEAGSLQKRKLAYTSLAKRITAPIQLRIADSTIRLSSNDETDAQRFEKDDESGRRFTLRVQRGQAGLDTKDGLLVIHAGDEVTRIERKVGERLEPELHYRRLAFQLVQPRGGEMIVDDATSPEKAPGTVRPVTVRLNWNVLPSATDGSPLVAELSPDPEFKQAVREIRISAAEPPLSHIEQFVDIPAPEAPVTWYWRVHTPPLAGMPSGLTSETETFVVAPPVIPALRFPARLAYTDPGKAIDFVWSGVPGALDYELQLGEKVVRTAQLTALVEDLRPGRLSWRVRAGLREGGFTPWSASRELRIKSIEESETRAPTAQRPRSDRARADDEVGNSLGNR